MKHLFFSFFLTLCSLANFSVHAQSFEVEHEIVTTGVLGYFSIQNKIQNTTAANVTLQWTVVECDWPTDWLANIGVCDNTTCLGATTVFNPNNEATYLPGWGDFRLDGDVPVTATDGTYTTKIRFNNKFNTNDTAWQTYIITKAPVGTPNVVKAGNKEVTLYPNPANDILKVAYSDGADIKDISICNVIGKQVGLFGVTDNKSASLNVEGLPAGVYFVRLINSKGDVFATRKFTKQ